MPVIPEQPLRIVVAGCGAMSHTWIEYVLARSDCRIVGLVDLNPETARQAAVQFGLADAVVGQDLRTVIREAHANLVFNLAVPSAHRQIALTAFGEGCAVMSEKPLPPIWPKPTK